MGAWPAGRHTQTLRMTVMGRPWGELSGWPRGPGAPGQVGQGAAEEGTKSHIEKTLWGMGPRHCAKCRIPPHSGIFEAMPKGTGALDNSMDRWLRKKRQLS